MVVTRRTEVTMLRAATASPCSVLIAEDDPSIRVLLSTALRRRRLNFATVVDGDEALRMLERVVNAVIFKPFDILQLEAYVKASCVRPPEDRRQSRTVGVSI
jgi:PleD family two-component response regulator